MNIFYFQTLKILNRLKLLPPPGEDIGYISIGLAVGDCIINPPPLVGTQAVG